MSTDRAELIFTLYVLCSDWHSGQWSRGYRLLSRISTRYKRVSIGAGHAEEIRDSELYAELQAKYKDKL